MGTPRKYLKFMKAPHLASLMRDGELMLSSLDYFTHLEMAKPGGKIGDAYESGPIIYVDRLSFDGETPQEILDAVARYFDIKIGRGATGTIGPYSVRQRTPHSLIYSVTFGNEGEMAKSFEAEGYDAGVEVVDIAGLQQAIWEEGTLQDGRPLRDLLRPGSFGDVHYVEKRLPFAEALDLPTGAFVKPLGFDHQMESRIVCEAIGPVHDLLLVRIPAPERFFKPMVQTSHAAAASAQGGDKPVLDRLLDRLLDVLARFEDRQTVVQQARQDYFDVTARLTGSECSAAQAIFDSGGELTPGQVELLAAKQRMWDAMTDRRAMDAMQPEIQRLAWTARFELGLRSHFETAGADERYVKLLVAALRRDPPVAGMDWTALFYPTIAGPYEAQTTRLAKSEG